jgi:hypothetical protein
VVNFEPSEQVVKARRAFRCRRAASNGLPHSSIRASAELPLILQRLGFKYFSFRLRKFPPDGRGISALPQLGEYFSFRLRDYRPVGAVTVSPLKTAGRNVNKCNGLWSVT